MENLKKWRNREVVINRFNKPVSVCFFLSLLFLLSCTPSSIIQPNPASSPVTQKKPLTEPVVCDTGQFRRDIDFADAFDTSVIIEESVDDANKHDSTLKQSEPIFSQRFPPYSVASNKVRVALLKDISHTVVYSVGAVHIRSDKVQSDQEVRGRVTFSMKSGRRRCTISAGGKSFSVALPCTLLSKNEYNFIEIADGTYRGALIVTQSNMRDKFTIVNYLEVEEYLRGVVPLELGKRSNEELEALKAQAVAARTYTYRRIFEQYREPFDVVNTVADQVYGGASVEYRESDIAIKSTKDLIMTYNDSIIMAYYHSTCGGSTADVYEAWKKPPRPYLRPVSDLDPEGRAWCHASAYFTWEEKWPWKQFSSIVIKSLRNVNPNKQYKGVVNSITVNERYPCGRVKKATITGTGWAAESGGDQIRFVLRRGTQQRPILRSSNFSVIAQDRTITIKGRGYGHGVGMCQMGAIGRARAGQRFSTILTSYYPGISLVTATATKGK